MSTETSNTAPVYGLGDSPVRLEDERLLRGQGRFVDDLRPPDLTHGVVLRSPWAHARISRLDASAARTMPGVLVVLTGAEQSAEGISPTWPHAPANVQTGEPFPCEPQPPLALGRVRYVGEAVAFVVAETHAQALDALERIEVEYEALPTVTSPRAAREIGAPALSDQVERNTCLSWTYGEAERTGALLAAAPHVVSLQVHNHRVAHCAMEPRGALGWHDPTAARYRLEVSSQNVHVIRDHIARSLGVAPDAVHLHAPDVGGGFGVRNFVYAEYILVLWAARRVGRPVKWISSRMEGFGADHQARDFEALGTLALDDDGRFLALRVQCDFNLGAFLIGAGGGVPTGQFCTCPGTVYAIEAVELQIAAALTNTTPIGVTRGPGFAEMVDLVERLIDKAARETGIDRVTLRRRNLVPANAMPWTNAVGNVIDSGDFPGCFERALAAANFDRFAERRRDADGRGVLRGIGFANHIKATGGLDEENAELRFDDGALVLTTGTQAIGQGHETTFRQIVGTLLGLPFETIRYVAGDTAAIAMGGGHGSSRATYMAGTAMHRASAALLEQARPLAAELLEAAAGDLEFERGRFQVAGTDRAVGLLEVAAEAQSRGQRLGSYQHFRRDAMTFPCGCHVAEVEIDAETGAVELVAYTAIDDYGVLVNPMVARGQALGAIAQGVGQALLEQVVYDPATAQLLTGSFMDYALPRADVLCAIDLDFHAHRCTTNPLGVKGCGEAGAIAAYPAIANAVLDALSGRAPAALQGAATPSRVWGLLAKQG